MGEYLMVENNFGFVLMFPCYVNIKEQNINVYVDRETSEPDQKLFPLSDTLPSQPILGSFTKKNLQGLIKNSVVFPGVIKKKSCEISKDLGFRS